MATLLLQLVLVVGLLGSVQLAPVYENKNSSVGLDNTKVCWQEICTRLQTTFCGTVTRVDTV